MKNNKNKRIYLILGAIWLFLIAGIIGIGVYENSTAPPQYGTEEQLVGLEPDLASSIDEESELSDEAGNSSENNNTSSESSSLSEENNISDATNTPGIHPSDDKTPGVSDSESEPAADSASDVKKVSSTNKPTKTKKDTDKVKPTKAPKKYYSFTIECKKILNRQDLWRDGLEEFIPKDGVYYSGKLEYKKDLSVYDALKKICDKNNILMESRYTPIYETYYVAGIGNLYEFDCGSESGWKYSVNGVTPGVGSSLYTIEPGDEVVFFYDIAI